MKRNMKPKRSKGNPNHVPVPPTKVHSLGHRLEEYKRSTRKNEMRNAKINFDE